MPKKKMSFFERLTGTINVDEYEGEEMDETGDLENTDDSGPTPPDYETEDGWNEEEEGQLAVDVYQTPSEIVIQTMVAGVRPDDLDISITREMVTVKGRREAPRHIDPNDYYIEELYWGSFSRTVVLPEEIEVEEAEAVENHGLLIIKLPKIDTGKQTKLKVKSQ